MTKGRTIFLLPCLLLIPTLASGVASSVRQSGPAAASRSVWDGVYTLGQAKRGESVYETLCSSCHGSDLQGDGADAAPLAGTRFMRKWNGRPLKVLFTVAKETMPQDAPGTLSKEACADLLAYILRANGFPDGTMQLGSDQEELGRIVLDESVPSQH